VVCEKSLSSEKLATLYRGAMGFINVSLAEGFNLPLLEAAASHLPILTSDLPIHREIIGSSGRFCDPSSTKSIGGMILNFLRDSDLQEELKQKSMQLATQYTWEQAAETTLSLYRKLV
jgi:alpha-1,3-rhamnosyl/mannosyltransferase